ncbi:formylglycine-generating enzyme family protein [Saliphagus sp. LR7]|uniref:formylglycine-generating enzyme family protein n=1 Tax=Saliphagus sp. LR7 TaxID=2282654 RepID=UPI000DF83AEC|nr:formylglycine-generating enzyme family protein [Saliphagus sp. LR7]
MTDDRSPDSCCAPERGSDGEPDRSENVDRSVGAPGGTGIGPTRRLEGGPFRMGTDEDVGFEGDGEGPAREVVVDPVEIEIHAVTNAEFYRFVDDTGYTTDAERYGWSFVFEPFRPEGAPVAGSAGGAEWWTGVEGACWHRPEGPGSSVVDRLDHPAVHVSWNDAVAYCEWAGARLPTEAEWEYAARGGLEGRRFPWGDELEPGGNHRSNVWQGEFPTHDTGADGYVGTAPVDAFEPNGYGLYNVVGNVWEWCADAFDPDYHERTASSNPIGTDGEARSMRGGSYLCHESWCNRYRVAARSKNTPDSSTGNIGFRCILEG